MLLRRLWVLSAASLVVFALAVGGMDVARYVAQVRPQTPGCSAQLCQLQRRRLPLSLSSPSVPRATFPHLFDSDFDLQQGGDGPSFVFEPASAEDMHDLALPVEAAWRAGSIGAQRHAEALLAASAAAALVDQEAHAHVVPVAPAPATAAQATAAPVVKQLLAKVQARPTLEEVKRNLPDLGILAQHGLTQPPAGLRPVVTSPFTNDGVVTQDGVLGYRNDVFQNGTRDPTIEAAAHQVSCDVFTKGGLLLEKASHFLVPAAEQSGLRGSYSFDELVPSAGRILDTSGAGRHGKLYDRYSQVPPSSTGSLQSTGRMGAGTAIRFNGELVAEFPALGAAPDAKGQAGVTVSAWVFVANDKVVVEAVDKGCHLFGTGHFSVSLLPSSNLILHAPHHSYTSHAKVRFGVWTYLAFTLSNAQQRLSLYVNGVRDITAKLVPPTPLTALPQGLVDQTAKKDAAASPASVFVGSLPAKHRRFAACRASFLVDDLQVYDRPMSSALLEAQSFPALSPVEPGFVRLGCSRTNTCNRNKAAKTCPQRYHLCTKTELEAGAYSAARQLGWLDWTDDVWVADPATHDAGSSDFSAVSFLELDQKVASSQGPLFAVPEAVDLAALDQGHHDADELAAAVAPSSGLEGEAAGGAQFSPYALIDADDQGLEVPAPAPAPAAAPAAASAPPAAAAPAPAAAVPAAAAAASKPTPMPSSSRVAPHPTGLDSRATKTTGGALAHDKAKSMIVGQAAQWVAKVALCCASA